MDGAVGSMAGIVNRALLGNRFLNKSGWQGSQRVRIAGDASNRKYDRLTLTGGKTAILMDAAPNSNGDMRPFIRIAEHLRGIGLSAPKIFAADEDAGFLLIEDFGDALFSDLMTADPSCQTLLYRASVDVLIDLHNSEPLLLPQCDAKWLTEMTDPVFEWYARGAAASLSARFTEVFSPLAKAFDRDANVTILRDYHAQNLIWLSDRTGTAQVGILDFQDALLGHPAYDLVSILQDARRDVSPGIEAEMINYYLSQTCANRKDFMRSYALLGAQRNLRILGIFARLCLRDGKPSYVDLIPRVWNYVQRNLSHPDLVTLAESIFPLPEPTPAFLENLKTQCAASP